MNFIWFKLIEGNLFYAVLNKSDNFNVRTRFQILTIILYQIYEGWSIRFASEDGVGRVSNSIER